MRLVIPTADAAKAVGISQRTLQRWITARQVSAPTLTLRNGRAVRLWSHLDVKKLKDAKERIYRKGRGRKSRQRT